MMDETERWTQVVEEEGLDGKEGVDESLMSAGKERMKTSLDRTGDAVVGIGVAAGNLDRLACADARSSCYRLACA